ncbi:phosphoribosylanthranilate isomerase [Solitalea canadensis]|uniref:N-(5'-phosphoribosyl)anthranilate isomerase n=1 Tax=Solitalea canadensis (strain ATCC 29591 / DSM 3403 / JCM 21819 / LMG 8368 / NBRC 15130 / NCIMB 12057 / USAM 9D) TaxID=929556 RepID=H8KVI1_SOLCM|nr:phosphoribosylanthranilate isomerase [Solitalea canadensis DSM 3403]
MKIKICGMKHRDNIIEVATLQPDYLGFIFHPGSPRFVDDLSVLKAVPASIKKVAVFVNESLEKVMDLVAQYDFDAVQLHGSEKPDYCSQLKSPTVEVIKAFGVDESFDFNQLKRYKDACDAFLFDTKSAQYGGTGLAFNWQLLKQYDQSKPYFLSGGLGIENSNDIASFNSSGGNIGTLDFNSKLEVSPGLKDVEKVREVINKMRNL